MFRNSSMIRHDGIAKRKYLNGMERLVRAVQELSLARDIETIRNIVRTTARELTGADGATFVLRDGDYCHYVDEDAIAPLWKGKCFPMEICISGWVMLNKQPVVIENIYEDHRIPADAYRPTFVKSLAMVPIRTTQPIGAIGNYWASYHRPSQEDVNLLQALADTTAVAMENVQVYTELEERVHQRTAELELANQEIKRLSLRDELTGLYNRRGFYLLAEQELKRARRQNVGPVAAFIDVDGLKWINDRLGHEMGDHLISSAAQVIKNTVRDSDIVGRIGGDEFCVLALDCSCEGIHDRLQAAVKEFNSRSQLFELSLSIGAVQPVGPDETLESLISRADQIMYAEKRAHKKHLVSVK